MQVTKRDGSKESFDFAKIERLNDYATQGLDIDKSLLHSQIRLLVYSEMSTQEIFKAQIQAASGLISLENPDFTYVAARYLLADTYKTVTGNNTYPKLGEVFAKGVLLGRYSPEMLNFDFEKLEAALVLDRDFQFDYFGLQNIVDRYLMRDFSNNLLELPQHFFMRVAMGLSLNEANREDAAIAFYHNLSSFDFMSSTPTLFNSGTLRSQLSSCYLNTVNDQISAEEGEHRFSSIYGTIEEAARLSKFAGGIGTDWTRVRGAGSLIKGTNGKSSGVVPYLKVFNDTAVAVNQGGKRKGSFSPYLEPWHTDFWGFCELKKEFGDDRLRTHDIYPAAWLPDLFMQRVRDNGVWSEFEVHKYPELHELYGEAFTLRYEELERENKFVKQRSALAVWKHIIECLFETGHPWITFKDECNRRSPQQHVGVVHSSNLCTEITLNTSDSETAVCNLGSVNLARHIKDGKLDKVKLKTTVTVAMRMLDNVIDLNYYPSDRAEKSNLRHRPVGLGIMGETEAKVACGIAFDSEEGVQFSDEMMELVSYFAIEASAQLAVERGAYPSFEGSSWSKGVLPIDTARSTESALGAQAWSTLRSAAQAGMRNSNCMAIAPTATISILTGTTPCIEPLWQVVREESNISGSFKVVDPCVRYHRPDLLKTVWEIEPEWIIRSAAARQKWIDQAQSVNLFIKDGTRGSKLSGLYILAWEQGLKTTYYMRTETKKKQETAPTKVVEAESLADEGKFCSISSPDCESCQ